MPVAPLHAVPFPRKSNLRSLYNNKPAYYIDAFAVSLPRHPSSQYKAETLARTFFGESPAWFSMLMWIRDRVMSIFGVKRSTDIQAEAKKKGFDTIAFFPVISHAEREVIVGENDRHLNFQTSILIREEEDRRAVEGQRDGKGGGEEMVVTTVVHCHGLLGKAYITIIKPFHVMIVKYNLARMPNRIVRDNH